MHDIFTEVKQEDTLAFLRIAGMYQPCIKPILSINNNKTFKLYLELYFLWPQIIQLRAFKIQSVSQHKLIVRFYILCKSNG